MMLRTVRSGRRRTPSIIWCSATWKMPVCVASAIIERISSSLTARAVFLVRMPSTRTTSSVEPCSTHTSGALRIATISMGARAREAIASGLVSAQRFGTSSPMMSDRKVTPTTTMA